MPDMPNMPNMRPETAHRGVCGQFRPRTRPKAKYPRCFEAAPIESDPSPQPYDAPKHWQIPTAVPGTLQALCAV